MTSVAQNRIALAVAVVAPCALGLWILSTRTAAFPSTYVFFALLFIALALIGLNIWQNRATGSMAQVIYEADVTPLTTPPSPLAHQSSGRWGAWQSRGDALAHTWRVRAMLAFSAALTGALLFYVWLT
jgi:hypothetical protein